MDNSLQTEMELLISQLKNLNDQFSENLENNKNFDSTKEIYLRIKEANVKLKRYLGSNNTSDLFAQNTGQHAES